MKRWKRLNGDMKRKKKISVTYMERDSKRNGLQGICRIVHDGVSTMFVIGVVDKDDTKEWFKKNKDRIRKILELERDIIDSFYIEKFTVKGFHKRWKVYEEPLYIVLNMIYVNWLVNYELKTILTVTEFENVYKKTHSPLNSKHLIIILLYTLLNYGFSKSISSKIKKILSNEVYAHCLNYSIYNLYKIKIEKKEESSFLDLALTSNIVLNDYSTFLKDENVTYSKSFEKLEVKEKADFVYSVLNIKKMDSDASVEWFKKAIETVIKEIYIAVELNPSAY